MNKKSVSIFLALITATTALLTGCGGNLPGIASVTEVQGVNSSETVSSKEASESSKSSTSSVSSKDETTTNKDTPSTPEEKKEFDGSYQKNADGTIAMNYGAILHAWCWDFATITEHLDDIKEAGYTSIQTSPINQCKVGESGGKTLFSEKGGKWYYHYQPTDYVIGNYQLGSKEKFETLCKEAKKRDLKIIVDVPLNHVSSDLSAVTQNVLDICDNPFHDRGEIGSYSSRKQVTQNDLLGLKDLNTQDPKVQQYELKYLKDVIASGASGFRFDAAKHIELPDDEKEYASDFWTVMILTLDFLLVMAVYVYTFPRRRSSQASGAALAFLYMPVMMAYLCRTRNVPHGFLLYLLIFICASVSDVCALAVGMAIGRHKLAPVLSPKKTIEGAVGGIAGSAIVSCLLALVLPAYNTGSMIRLFLLIGICGSIIGQTGDLAASAIKRNNGIKDYGTLIPGHGGIMDRFDSIVFTAPVIYYLSFLMNRMM